MSWFERIVPSRIKTERRTRSVPEGLWTKCPACDAVLYRAEIERNLYVCPKCSHHMRIGARERLRALLDPEPISEIGANVLPDDPLKFKDSRRYRDRTLPRLICLRPRTLLRPVLRTRMVDDKKAAVLAAFFMSDKSIAAVGRTQ